MIVYKHPSLQTYAVSYIEDGGARSRDMDKCETYLDLRRIVVTVPELRLLDKYLEQD